MAENNLQQFRQLPTLKKIDLLVDLHKAEGYQAVEQLLNDLHIKELEAFALDFENFVGTSGSRNRFRSVIRKVLHQRQEGSGDIQPQSNLSELITKMVPLLLDAEASEGSIGAEKEYLNEVMPDGYSLVDLVEKDYMATLQSVRRNHGRKIISHYIITIENESGIHSFCWNKNSRTLIYGLNAEDLMYIKLGEENLTEIAELIQELLEV